MTDLRYIAERWIAEYGVDTPRVVREWATQMDGAPGAAQFLVEIAECARTLLDDQAQRSAGPASARA